MPFKMISQCCTAHPILCMTSVLDEKVLAHFENMVFFSIKGQGKQVRLSFGIRARDL